MATPFRPELSRYLRTETVGGTILLAAAAVALIWANSPAADAYFALRDWQIGPAALHLNLSVGTWAQDGLLAVFFFVAGLELKRELVVGELADRRRPCSRSSPQSAVSSCPRSSPRHRCGYARDGTGLGDPGRHRHRVRTGCAGDDRIAHPGGRRVFLLSLAVVDDLLAIVLIAVLFTASIAAWWLLAAWPGSRPTPSHSTDGSRPPALRPTRRLRLVRSARRGDPRHPRRCGAGPADPGPARPGRGDRPAARLEHRIQPFSAGFCVPVFALFASGVAMNRSCWSRCRRTRSHWLLRPAC